MSLVGFEGFQRVMGPVEFVVFAGFVEFMKFKGVLWASGVGWVQRVSEGMLNSWCLQDLWSS